jgi:hypothetical protein
MPLWTEVIGAVRDVDPPFSDGWRPAYYTALEQQSLPSGFTLLARGGGAFAELLRPSRRPSQQRIPPSLAPTGGRCTPLSARCCIHAAHRQPYSGSPG